MVLARLYRQTKAGKVATTVASRLAFILSSLGRVTACERLIFPRNPPGMDELGVTAATFASMKHQPFALKTRHYSECEHRADCRADGRPTGWGTA